MRNLLRQSSVVAVALTALACGNNDGTSESSELAADGGSEFVVSSSGGKTGSSSGNASKSGGAGGATGASGAKGMTTAPEAGKAGSTPPTAAGTGGAVAGAAGSVAGAGGSVAGSSGASGMSGDMSDDDAGVPPVAGSGGSAGEAGGGGQAGQAGGGGSGGVTAAGSGGAGGSAGSAAGSGGNAASAATFTQVYALMNAGCAGATCHVRATVPGGMLSMIDKPTAYRQLVNVDAVRCPGEKRVVPKDADKSELVASLKHVQLDNCTRTPRMPDNLPQWEDDDVALVTSWIEAGALDN